MKNLTAESVSNYYVARINGEFSNLSGLLTVDLTRSMDVNDILAVEPGDQPLVFKAYTIERLGEIVTITESVDHGGLPENVEWADFVSVVLQWREILGI